MMLHGYCTGCHKIKRVQVSRIGGRTVPTGICADCQDKADEARRTPRRTQ